MIEIKRDQLKTDPVYRQVFEIVKKNHVVANHTAKTLYENRHVKDFCEEARHFTIMPGLKPLYIHYDVASWWKEPMGVQVRIESIGVYDDFMEFEAARMHQLHRAQHKDIPNIN